MRTKQIHASNMQDALAIARESLGDDAVLLNTQKNSNGIVVTFAVEDSDDAMLSQLLTDDLLDDLDNLDAITPFTPHIPRASTAQVELTHPAMAIVSEALAYHHLPAALVARIEAHIRQQPLKPSSVLEVAETALANALGALIAFTPIATAAKPPAKALMLVGPHGAGKTSTIAKLAAELTLQKQQVVLISTDMERLGGTDNLHQLADILKCSFYICDTRANLKSLLTQFQNKAWVLIDSTGANIYEFKPLKELGEFASLQGVEPILTCPAGMDADEAQEMAGVFNFLNIERMIITRLDAVRRMGSVFSALTTGGYALSNFTSSAVLSDACSPISPHALARLMLRHVRERMTH